MTRIGMVNYINTAPIYEIWKDEVHRPDWQIVEAAPAVLNRLLAGNRLDLGFVSAYEYAIRPELYQIMDDLSISATGPVGSVYLFSKVPITELDGQRVLLTGQSATSVYLLRIILEDFIDTRPSYTYGEVFAVRESEDEPTALLAIGDEALRFKTAKDTAYPVQLDLGECWYQHTGLPFVFSVCAVRRDFLHLHQDTARKIRHTLIRCRDRGLARLPEIVTRTAARIPMDYTACFRYFHSIEYDLGAGKQKALEQFFTLLAERGEADCNAVPLRLFA